jgi:hypothetical protein
MAKLTKLAAINIILSNVGQSPVTSIDASNPAIKLAESILDEVTNALQTEQWHFNTEQDYPFVPDVNGNIIVPSNLLALDLVPWDDRDIVIRSGKLYDKTYHTYTFTTTLYLDVVWSFDFIDMPEVFKQYSAIRAANLFAGRAVGSTEAVKYSEREESIARSACMEYETRQADYNIFSDVAGATSVIHYRPYDVVTRPRRNI